MAKGGNNERKKAKEISLWFSEGEADDWLWRDNSGARATARGKQGKTTANSYGDMIMKDSRAESLLRISTWEFKKGYDDLDVMNVLDSKGQKPTFKQFWLQVCRDAEAAAKAGWGSEPILVTHRDRKNALLTMRNALYNEMVGFYGKPDGKPRITLYADDAFDCTVVIMRYEDFLAWCSPKFFVDKWERKRACRTRNLK